MEEECFDSRTTPSSNSNPYNLLFNAASLIPVSHYLFAFLVVSVVVVYNFFEFHFLQDLVGGFRGQSVTLSFNFCSPDLYDSVVSKCRFLHGRYLVTPWLSSPHIQTTFLNFFGRAPVFNYRRQLFHTTDGGTLALDWLLSSDVAGCTIQKNNAGPKDDTTPLIIVIPGLMSDSTSPYVKHLAYDTVKHGWNVVVCNHRGLGGMSITSDCFYNAGWTEDIRKVIDYLHQEYPKAPLFVIGTSIGANILVKYLGEDGENVPVAGAAAICSPWDLLLGDRFISRKLQQKFYDRAIAIGLKEYAELHQPFYSRLGDWDGIKKSRSIRDFDNYATCLVGKYETVDTYYRRCSSASYVRTVAVPVLCINALDDPVCTREAIPWDECRANKNIVLATTQHGGHLAFFEGITASGLWWVKAVDEFFRVLHTSPLMHTQKKNLGNNPLSEASIDHGPFVNVAEDGLVAAMSNESIYHVVEDASDVGNKVSDYVQDTKQDNHITEADSGIEETYKQAAEGESSRRLHNVTSPIRNHIMEADSDIEETTKQAAEGENSRRLHNVTSPIRKCLNQLSLQNKKSMWLLAYVAIITSWPLIGSALSFLIKKRRRSVLAAASVRR